MSNLRLRTCVQLSSRFSRILRDGTFDLDVLLKFENVLDEAAIAAASKSYPWTAGLALADAAVQRGSQSVLPH